MNLPHKIVLLGSLFCLSCSTPVEKSFSENARIRFFQPMERIALEEKRTIVAYTVIAVCKGINVRWHGITQDDFKSADSYLGQMIDCGAHGAVRAKAFTQGSHFEMRVSAGIFNLDQKI